MGSDKFDNLSSSREDKTRKIIAIAGGKGGIGKTVLSIAFSLELANIGYSVTLVDGDLGGANLATLFGLYKPVHTLKDFFIGNVAELSEIIHQTDIKNLQLVPGTVGDYGLANIEYGFKQKFLRQLHTLDADFIVMDLGAGTSFDQLDFFNTADFGVVVAIPDPMAVQDCFNFIKLAFFRRIFKRFHKIPELRDAVQQFLHSPQDEEINIFNQVKDKIFTENFHYKDDWLATTTTFDPLLLINQVEDEHDYREGFTLQIAAKEMFGLELNRFDIIHADEAFHRLSSGTNPVEFLHTFNDAQQDVKRVCQQFYSATAGTIPQKLPIHKLKSETASENNQVICSVNCELWGKCSMQMGGYPCRVQALGYINQKK